jgi:transcription antitermination factor NusG
MMMHHCRKGWLAGIIACCLCLLSPALRAQQKSETDLINKVIESFQKKDKYSFAALFPAADTIALATLRKTPDTSRAHMKAAMMLESPALLMYQDSLLQAAAFEQFETMISKGNKVNIDWTQSLLSSFELVQASRTRDERYRDMYPECFLGYVFIEDVVNRKHYAFVLNDIMKIADKWYCGSPSSIFEASGKDELNAKLKAEMIRIRKGIPEDTTEKDEHHVTTAQEDEDKDENPKKRRQVLERKLYTGMLDNEIPVLLYIRSLKGDCPEKICSWEAIFKFGDQDEYTRQVVTHGADGKWQFNEVEAGTVMELELKDKAFTGTFTATSDKVDYEAELKETPMSKKKMESLDAIIERDMVR